MRVFLALLIALPCWAATWGVPFPTNPDTLGDDSVYIWAAFPNDGDTSISVTQEISWAVPSYPNLTRSQCKIWVADQVALSGDSVKSGYTITVSSDTVRVTRTTALANYFEIQAVLWVTPANPLKMIKDTTVFRTAAGVTPFRVYTTWGRTFSDETATGTCVLRVMRPYGTTVYCYEPDSEATAIITTDAVYDSERTRRVVEYSMTGVPQGLSRYYFYAMTVDSAYSDTQGVVLAYTRTRRGVPQGTVGR